MELQPITQKFTVAYQYSCYFTQRMFKPENHTLAKIINPQVDGFDKRTLVIIDDGVTATHPKITDEIKTYFKKHRMELADIQEVPGGEECKNGKKHLESILAAINSGKICRHSYVVAIGGGAVLDLAGYAAAIAHRGVKLIRVPTTVLSQNDAGVGVKNGVNYFGKKNFTGTFALPVAIINDQHFLTTLDQRDWVAGISEAIKVALLKDRQFFETLEQEAALLKDRDAEAMNRLIYRCAELHMHHISEGGDPFENGSSRPLDFGHWSAHKLEQLTNYSIKHGEAVALGLAIDCTYAHLKGFLDKKSLQRILNTLKDVGFTFVQPELKTIEVEALLEGIEEFREHLGGQLTITLIEGIGKKKDVHQIDRAIMAEAVKQWIK